MARKLYYELPADEREAFEAACARHGFVSEDFEIYIDEGEPAGDESRREQPAVSVGRVVGAGFEQYPVSAAATWVTAFEKDLERDAFGFPLAD